MSDMFVAARLKTLPYLMHDRVRVEDISKEILCHSRCSQKCIPPLLRSDAFRKGMRMRVRSPEKFRRRFCISVSKVY